MAFRAQPQPRQTDRASQAIAADVKSLRSQTRNIALLDGKSVTADLVAATPLEIPHPLKRQPQGWILTDVSASAIVYRTAWSSTTITLEASANATVAVWVY